MIDANQFYREITGHLFNHFLIEDALHAALKYLSRVLPADLLVLQYTNIEAGSHRIVATATKEEGKRSNASIPFTPSARKMAAQRTQQVIESKNPVVLSNHPEQDEDLKTVLDFFNLGPSSLMVMALDIGGRLVGSLAVFAAGHDQYTEAHAGLFALLRQPAAVSLVSSHLYLENVKLAEMLKDDNRFLHNELRHLSGDHIVGEKFGLKNVMEMVRQVAGHDSPVLLLGETGTGKDLIAGAIHRMSSRKDGPYITVNCGAIPDTLLDSELFGHEKGAFTGALSQKRGRFERADKGTLFLDEIGELPPQAQTRLLRVLQNKEIERVGGTRTISVDIRIIAATNRDLEAMVSNGQFREDLWFRLSVFPVQIPPLRQRVADIPALVSHFIERKTQELKIRPVPRITETALGLLEGYQWPGNVRELENIIERALIIARGDTLEFPFLFPGQADKGSPKALAQGNDTRTFDDVVMAYLGEILERSNGKINGSGGAAELSGLNPSTLRHKLRKYGLMD